MPLEYDPTEYGSMEEAARSRANMEREFGMPRQRHPDTPFGRQVNRHHAAAEDAANREFGGPSTAEVYRKWGCSSDAPKDRGYDP